MQHCACYTLVVCKYRLVYIAPQKNPEFQEGLKKKKKHISPPMSPWNVALIFNPQIKKKITWKQTTLHILLCTKSLICEGTFKYLDLKNSLQVLCSQVVAVIEEVLSCFLWIQVKIFDWCNLKSISPAPFEQVHLFCASVMLVQNEPGTYRSVVSLEKVKYSNQPPIRWAFP